MANMVLTAGDRKNEIDPLPILQFSEKVSIIMRDRDECNDSYLLCDRHFSKCFININSFNFHNNTRRKILVLFPYNT